MPGLAPLVPLLLAIVAAPLAYGSTTPETVLGLDVLLGLAVVLWGVRKVRQEKRFHLVPLPVCLVVLLALVAIAQVFNPHSVFDPGSWNLRDLEGGWPVVPRTVDRATSLALLPHLLVLGATFVAVLDLTHSRRFRWMLLGGLAVSGVIVALYGMAQKAAGGDVLLWGHLRPDDNTFFGGYRYHAHAASFLNLCWPASLVLFLRSAHEERPVARNLWGLAWMLTFGALFVNTSKFGHAVALPLLLFAGVVVFRRLPPPWVQPSWRMALTGLAVAIGVLLLTVPSLEVSALKWQQHLDQGASMAGRREVYAVGLTMAREAPLFGFGTGSFAILFPYYTVHLGDRLGTGIWWHLHQDYLQAVIEWGKVGVLFWAALFLPPVMRQLVRSLGPRGDLSGAAALVGVVAVLLHAGVDFPLQIASIELLFLVYLAILWRPHHRDAAPAPKQRLRPSPERGF